MAKKECHICKSKYSMDEHKSMDFGGVKSYSSQQFKLCPKCDKEWKQNHKPSEVYLSEIERERIKKWRNEINVRNSS